MAIDLSLTADCVAPLESYLTDQEPTPEEVEALLEYEAQDLDRGLSDMFSALPQEDLSPEQRLDLAAKLQQIPRFTEAQLEQIKQSHDLVSIKAITLLNLFRTSLLLQLATWATDEAQSLSMKSYCQTMQTNLQSKIDSLTHQFIALNEETTCCDRYLMQVADDAATSVPHNDDPAPCDPPHNSLLSRQEIDHVIDRQAISALPTFMDEISSNITYLMTEMKILGNPPKLIDRLTSTQITSTQITPTQITPTQLAQLRQYKDSLLLVALLYAEFTLIHACLNPIHFCLPMLTDRGQDTFTSFMFACRLRQSELRARSAQYIDKLEIYRDQIVPTVATG